MLPSSHESKLPNLTKVCLGWHHLAAECSPWCKKLITRTASSPILKKELCRHQSFAAQPPEVALRPLKLMPGSNLSIHLCITKVEKRFSSHSPPPLSCHSLTPPSSLGSLCRVSRFCEDPGRFVLRASLARRGAPCSREIEVRLLCHPPAPKLNARTH